MAAIHFLVILCLAAFAAMIVAQDATVSFNMFPVIDAAGLAANIGWTENCVVAM
jgi:hypothetical protein